MSIDYLIKRYQEAERLGTWHPLIGYWSLLFRWQVKHPKDVREIAELASHWHQWTHANCAPPPERTTGDTHSMPHSFCHGRCDEIDALIKKTLGYRLVEALVHIQVEAPQHPLNFDEKKSEEITHAETGGNVF